jgi:uridine kinase
MNQAKPKFLPFQIAVGAIAAELDEVCIREGRSVVVGVTGAVASGKSTFARRLSESVCARRTVAVVSTDHYLPNYDETPEHVRDMPESSDLARLSRDLAELRAGRATEIPQWSFETHSRIGARLVEPAEIIVVEGLHALHERARSHLDLAVFVEAPRDVRWARAVERERAGDRPWPLEYLSHFFEHVAEPTYAKHSALYRNQAHWVVENR